jgi:uncharacterized glyoxalase superfamily protein PhnB
MVRNRSMPPGIVIPEIPYSDVNEAAAWLAFGHASRLRIGTHRVQLTFGEGSIVAVGPHSAAVPRCSIMVRVEDGDRHHARARDHGARLLNPPSDFPCGERQYAAEDLAGHMWTLYQTLTDVDPAE